jgi:hypothetical protein
MQSKCAIRYTKLMVENGNRSGLYTTAEGIGGAKQGNSRQNVVRNSAQAAATKDSVSAPRLT